MSTNLRDSANRTREIAREKLDHASETLRHSAEVTRESARKAGQKTAEGVHSNPFAALIGGAALGALIGALLPRSKREVDTLGPMGRKINDKARNAAKAATDAGKATLDDLGINRDNAKAQVNRIVDTAKDAAKSVTNAVTDAVRK